MTDSRAGEGSICIGCGLCCDGTLHATATVRPEDEQYVRAVGLVIGEDGDRRFFGQPCPRFSCGACSVYDSRPKVCRTYRCSLLMKVDSGEISVATACEKIAIALELRTAVREIEPQAITPAQRSRLVHRLQGELEGPDRHAAAKGLLATASLEHFLNRWFLKESKEEDSGGPTEDA